MNFFELKGQKITEVRTENSQDEILAIKTESGGCFICHFQECCEDVRLVRIIGDVSNLIGNTITLAEEDSPSDPSWYTEGYDTSRRWTSFYVEAGGARVEFWILGESNGYYGTEVEVSPL